MLELEGGCLALPAMVCFWLLDVAFLFTVVRPEGVAEVAGILLSLLSLGSQRRVANDFTEEEVFGGEVELL